MICVECKVREPICERVSERSTRECLLFPFTGRSKERFASYFDRGISYAAFSSVVEGSQEYASVLLRAVLKPSY
jgi:hypothetical protein